MGCCISKCRPDDKHSQLEGHQFNHVHDKLVISQASPPTSSSSIIPHHSSSNKISPSPPSPTSSTSSISSFTCTTTSNNTISSTTSSLSSANSSSALTSKDRSFSNEFLWSCYKDNPHIIRINSLREATTTLHSMPTKPNYKAQTSRNIKPSSPKHSTSTPLKLSPPQNVFSMPQKRVRSNSPTNLTRQKSFRKEPSRMLGSPSPSRRFNINDGDKYGIANNNVSKRMINGPKVSASHYVSSSIRKEGFKATSPNSNMSSRRFHNGLRHRESCKAYRVGSKIDETVVNDVLSTDHDMDSIMEDIDNPLISLDCFIFL